MIVISLLMIGGIMAGIAWPLIQRFRAQSAGVAASDAADAADAAVARRSGLGSSRATEEICPYCSKLNPKTRRTCIECNHPLPVGDIGSLFQGLERDELIRECTIGGVLLLCMIIAMCVSSWLPMGGKIVILFVTCGALVYRFYRTLADG